MYRSPFHFVLRLSYEGYHYFTPLMMVITFYTPFIHLFQYRVFIATIERLLSPLEDSQSSFVGVEEVQLKRIIQCRFLWMGTWNLWMVVEATLSEWYFVDIFPVFSYHITMTIFEWVVFIDIPHNWVIKKGEIFCHSNCNFFYWYQYLLYIILTIMGNMSNIFQ